MRSLDLIMESDFEYLNIKNPTAARFYLLPKVHNKRYTRETFMQLN